jgi:hypothetical protein
MSHQEIRPETFHDSDTFYPAVIRVTTREELTKALRERTAQIIIGNKELARPFERLLWAQELRWWYLGTLAAALMAYGISQSYGVKLKGKYDLGRVSGEISLTPTKPAPPSSRGEE